jgi:hypothetical protein
LFTFRVRRVDFRATSLTHDTADQLLLISGFFHESSR